MVELGTVLQENKGLEELIPEVSIVNLEGVPSGLFLSRALYLGASDDDSQGRAPIEYHFLVYTGPRSKEEISAQGEHISFTLTGSIRLSNYIPRNVKKI